MATRRCRASRTTDKPNRVRRSIFAGFAQVPPVDLRRLYPAVSSRQRRDAAVSGRKCSHDAPQRLGHGAVRRSYLHGRPAAHRGDLLALGRTPGATLGSPAVADRGLRLPADRDVLFATVSDPYLLGRRAIARRPTTASVLSVLVPLTIADPDPRHRAVQPHSGHGRHDDGPRRRIA